MTKFFLEDIDQSLDLAFEAMDLLEGQKDSEKYGSKKIDKISDILDFIVKNTVVKK